MQTAFSNRASEKRASAAFTAAIHIALLALLLSFGPDFAEPVDPAPPLAVELVPTPPPEVRIVEPAPIEDVPGEAGSKPSGPPADRTEAGASAPKKPREDMDRTLAPIPVASFPPGPAPVTGLAPDGEVGMGQASGGTGAGAGGGGAGGRGTGTGTGSRSRTSPKVALEAPRWISKPTFSEMELHNPRQAMIERVSGTAVLACRVDSRQHARRCRILSETPRDYGFGAAALETVRLGRIGPALRDGVPDYKAWVRIPITFHNCKKSEPGCVDSRD